MLVKYCSAHVQNQKHIKIAQIIANLKLFLSKAFPKYFCEFNH